MCTDYPLTATPDNVKHILSEYQNHAMRTLAFACAKVADGTNPIDGTRLDTSGLTFLGVVAIADPVRTDVPDAVSDVIRAGIQIK